jgi:hypothetical protein
MSMARAALVASADVPVVVSQMFGDHVERVNAALRKEDERAVELVRFVFSPVYIEIRRALGLRMEGLS